jgi:hypothetical protein
MPSPSPNSLTKKKAATIIQKTLRSLNQTRKKKNVIQQYVRGSKALLQSKKVRQSIRDKEKKNKEVVQQFIKGSKALLQSKKARQRQRTNNIIDNNCSICLEPMTSHEPITVLPCEHRFHSSCIHQALRATNNRCPLCRNQQNIGFVGNLLSNVRSSRQAPVIAQPANASLRRAMIANEIYEIYDETMDLDTAMDPVREARASRAVAAVRTERARAARARWVLEAFHYQDDHGDYYDRDFARMTWLDMVAPVEVAAARAAERAEEEAWVAEAAAEEARARVVVAAARAAGIVANAYVTEQLIVLVWLGKFQQPPGWDNTSRTANLVRTLRRAKAAAEATGMVSHEMRVAEARIVEAQIVKTATGVAVARARNALKARVEEALADETLAANLETALAEEAEEEADLYYNYGPQLTNERIFNN